MLLLSAQDPAGENVRDVQGVAFQESSRGRLACKHIHWLKDVSQTTESVCGHEIGRFHVCRSILSRRLHSLTRFLPKPRHVSFDRPFVTSPAWSAAVAAWRWPCPAHPAAQHTSVEVSQIPADGEVELGSLPKRFLLRLFFLFSEPC